MRIGENIKTIRKQKGLKGKDLAALLGVSPSMISQWENQRDPSNIGTIEKIAKALDVDVLDLTGRDQEALNDLSLMIHKDVTEMLQKEIKKTVLDFLIEDHALDIINIYSSFNSKGKETAYNRLLELSEIPRYTDPEEDGQEDPDL